jgi:exopolysaccharide biosynthesis polyprenyl glycosylphosphotransferase
MSALYGLAAFALLASSDLARARINPRMSDDLLPLIQRLALPVLALPLLAPSAAVLAQFLRSLPLVVGSVLLGRMLSYGAMRRARAAGLVSEPTLIVGTGRAGVRMARTLQRHPEYGLAPVGFLEPVPRDGLPLPVLADPEHLEDVVRAFGITRVIVAFGAVHDPDLVGLIRRCDSLPVEVHVVPRLFELGLLPTSRETEDVWGMPLTRLRRSALRGIAWRTKRMFDVVVGSLLLLLSLPVLLIAAVAIRLSSPGPVLFRQARVGLNGRVFECLKLRTMELNGDSDTTWSVADDERRTPVGRFLRRMSLDELPQLLNVLRGDMSLVGPRPERPHFVDQFRAAVPHYDERHRVPAGMTGWAQVNGLRGDTSIRDRALFDNRYVENWSLWHDIVILVRTLGVVLMGAGR